MPAQLPPGVGNLGQVVAHGDTVTLRAGRDSVTVHVVEPNILRVHYHPNGATSPRTQVLDPIRTWSNDVPAEIETDPDPITISTDAMIVQISKDPVRLTICDQAGPRTTRGTTRWRGLCGWVAISSRRPHSVFFALALLAYQA